MNYGERPRLYHVRVLLAPTTDDSWVVLTPDLDMYEEELAVSNPDLEDFVYLGSSNTIPRRIPHNQVYGFQPMDPGTLARHMARGRTMANNIRAGLGQPPLGHPQPPQPPPAVGPPPAAPAVQGAPGRMGDDDLVWVAIEDAGGRKKGDVICAEGAQLPAGTVVLDDKAVVPGLLGGGAGCFARRVPRTEAQRFTLDDLRMLPVVFDAQGIRRREFSEAVASMVDGVPMGGGLQLEGPTTSLNLMKNMRDQNMTPATYHEYWLRTADIPKGDRSTYEHECLSRILESLITVDQLNICALQGAELICRRLQVIREAHRISPSSPDYSSADHFMGWKWRRAAQGVDMQLAAHVAQALKDEAAIAKEARKAREEQSMRCKRPNKTGGGGCGGDQK